MQCSSISGYLKAKGGRPSARKCQRSRSGRGAESTTTPLWNSRRTTQIRRPSFPGVSRRKIMKRRVPGILQKIKVPDGCGAQSATVTAMTSTAHPNAMLVYLRVSQGQRRKAECPEMSKIKEWSRSRIDNHSRMERPPHNSNTATILSGRL